MKRFNPCGLILIYLFVASCGDNTATDLIKKKGTSVIIAFNSDCPNCKRVKNDILLVAKKYPRVAFSVLLIDDTASCTFGNKDIKALTVNSKKIAKKIGLTVTPEVVVYKNGIKVYQGAITDQNKTLSQGKPIATQNYLELVLQQLNLNVDTVFKSKPAVGCYIEY